MATRAEGPRQVSWWHLARAPQGFWEGAGGQDGFESPGCEVSHPDHIGSEVRVIARGRPERRSLARLVSGCATHPPSKRRACAWTGEGATPVPRVVPADCVSQYPFSQPRRSATQVGFRELPGEGCHQSTLSTHPSPRGLPCPGGTAKTPPPPPYSGQLRSGQGRVATLAVGQHVGGKPLAELSGPSSSQGPSSQHALQELQQQCPKGYQVHIKGENVEEDGWQKVKSKKAKTDVAARTGSGECGKSVKFNPKCYCPPKQDPVRRQFWRFGTRAYEGQSRLVLGGRGEFQQAEYTPAV